MGANISRKFWLIFDSDSRFEKSFSAFFNILNLLWVATMYLALF